MLRFSSFIVATVLLSACEIADDVADDLTGPDQGDPSGTEQLDVSGVWIATLDGTVIQGEDGTGQTTTLTLTLVQSGTELTGTEAFTDTLLRSGSSALTGTLIGDSLTASFSDLDPQCNGRMFTSTATVTTTTPGSTMSIDFSASANSACTETSGTLVYTKQ